MLRYNDYARTFFSFLFLSLVLVICFGTHEDNEARWLREDNFKGVFLVLLAI